MPDSLHEEIRDRWAIEELFHELLDALDEKDWPAFDHIFADDVRSDWLPAGHPGGRDAVVGFMRRPLGNAGPTHHLLGPLRIKLDGDSAKVTARLDAYHAGAGSRAHLFKESLAAFETELIRTSAGWRIRFIHERHYVDIGTREVFEPPS